MNFEKLYQSVNLIQEVEIMDLDTLLQKFNKFSNQQIPVDVITDFYFTGLHSVDFFTSDFLQKRGYKNIFDVMREKI